VFRERGKAGERGKASHQENRRGGLGKQHSLEREGGKNRDTKKEKKADEGGYREGAAALAISLERKVSPSAKAKKTILEGEKGACF